MSRLGELSYPRAVLLGLSVTIGFALVVAASTSTVAFGAFNPAWDGAADLRGAAEEAGLDVSVLRTVDGYPTDDADGAVAIVLSPSDPYGSTEAARVAAFVEAGGTLVVAEDAGPHANALLAAVGAEARIDGRSLRDDRRFHRSPALPIVAPAPDATGLEGVEAVTLNHGTAVEPNGAAVLLQTSPYAYLDANGNAALDDDEALGPWPVAAAEPVGEGRVVVLGDPSALINVMLERPGNRAFLAALLGEHDRALLDYSHAEALPPLAVALLTVRASPLLQAVLGLVALGGIGLWAGWPRLRSRWAAVRHDRSDPVDPERLDAATVAGVLEARHPDWEETRLRRVTRALMRTADEPDADE